MAKACPEVGRWWGEGRGLARFLLGGCLFLGTGWATAWGAPTASKMLEYKPRHEVVCTTPAAAEVAGCKVELVKGKAGSGWALKDGQGKVLRQFYSTNGRNVDTYSYYRDGAEVYRESVTGTSAVPDQFRWLNAGGSKWGVDEDRNGTIDTWKSISPEEVGQEALKALATRDFARLQALMMSDDDLRALELPAERAEAIRARRKGAKARFEATIAKLTKLNEKATFVQLETGVPQCLPPDVTGARADVLRYTRATVLFESGGSNEWFGLGRLYQVGAAWKMVDAPTPGAGSSEAPDGVPAQSGAIGIEDPKLLKLVEALTEHDKKPVPAAGAEAVAHHLARANLLEQVVGLAKPEQRDPWIRQVADSLSSAVQAGAGQGEAVKRLASLEKQLVEAIPGSNLTAYVTFRRLQADYSVSLSQAGKDFNKVQQDWLEKLTGFYKAYPKSEDAPDALLQLGMVCEFLGKEVEAKNWYAQLAAGFKSKPQAAKAEGAIRRLSLEGAVMQVAAPLLSDAEKPFDIDQLKGKFVVLYYWASWNGQAAGDFAKLKALADANPKDVAVLSVNLDANVADARAFVARNPTTGTHLYQQGGLDSALATQYGITVLPSLFIVGRDGKCVSKSAQIGTLEDEVKKLIKK